MEKTFRLITYALVSVGVLAAGCGQKQQLEPVRQICLAGVHKQETMQAAQECLSKMHFEIDKADSEQGYIRTRPLSGAQWFEFWRSDNVGAFNNAEANIQDIRRTVELNFGPMEDKLCINCVVTVQRLSLPERKIASSAQAYSMFTKSSGGVQQLKLSDAQKKVAAWLDFGQDESLGTEILKRLENQITKMQEAKSL
jgi:hypothetical protein